MLYAHFTRSEMTNIMPRHAKISIAYCHDMQKSIPLTMNLSCLGAHDNVKWAVLGH